MLFGQPYGEAGGGGGIWRVKYLASVITKGVPGMTCGGRSTTCGLLLLVSLIIWASYMLYRVTVSARTVAGLLLWLAQWSGTLSRTISGIQMYCSQLQALVENVLFSLYQCN